MTILASLSSFVVASSSVMYVSASINYKDSNGAWQNVFHQFTDITTPTFLTGILINSAIRNRIATYVSSLSGAGTFSGTDVILAGAFELPLL